MRYVTCSFCGQDETSLVNEGPDLYLNRKDTFRLVQCRHCGLIYQNPQLTASELLDHYPEDNYELYSEAIETETSALQRASRQHGMMRRYRRVMRHVSQTGHVLDVGCATGSFLAMMRAQGWRASGVELSPYAAAYARETLSLDVRTGMLEEAGFPNDAFDVVTMWDVFEHVLDPCATLVEAARVLRPGGLLVTAVPNPASLEARLFGADWAGWDRPRHIHLYPPPALRKMLTETGFTEIKIESFSGRLNVTLLSVGFGLTARGVPPEKWRPWLNALYNFPLRLLTWPLYRLAEAGNQTTNMTAFAYLK